MKNIWCLASVGGLLWLSSPSPAWGCDACGCGPASGWMLGQPVFGVLTFTGGGSWQHSRVESVATTQWGLSAPIGPSTLVHVQGSSLHARYTGIALSGATASYSVQGVGDAWLGVTQRWMGKKQLWTVQGQWSLPTGAFSRRTPEGQLHATPFQPGNGQWGLRGGVSLSLGESTSGFLLESAGEGYGVNRYGNQKSGQWSFSVSRYVAPLPKNAQSAWRFAGGLGYSLVLPPKESGTRYGMPFQQIVAQVVAQYTHQERRYFAAIRPTLWSLESHPSEGLFGFVFGARIPLALRN